MTTFSWIVEAAWAADLTADPSTWTWVDISQYVNGAISVTRGRADASSQSQPARCSMRLRNTDSRFTPRHPLGAYYPNVTLGTPVRVRLASPATTRFYGYIDSLSPVWPSGNSQYAEVALTAQGALKRLNQGSALNSTLFRAITRATPPPIAYWPIEDGTTATQAAPFFPTVQPLRTVGTVKFGQGGNPPGSAQLADFTSGGGLIGNPPVVSSTSWRVEFAAKFSTIASGNFTAAIQLYTLGNVGLWEIDATDQVNGGLYLQWIKNGVAGSSYSNKAIDDGQWHWFQLDAQQSGSDIAWFVSVDGAVFFNGLITAVPLGAITLLRVNPTGSTVEEVSGFGHLTIWAPYAASLNTPSAATGYAGETAGNRITRLCAGQGVPLTISGGIEPMGPQGIARFVDLLRECEKADVGVLVDGLGAGVTYVGRDSVENQAVALALDAATQQVKLPFAPVEDDQRIVTDATISRTSGSSGMYADAANQKTKGDFQDGDSLNVYTDGVLVNQAAWRVHLGTVEEMRVPVVTLELVDHPELLSAWVATDIGDRYTVANPPAQYPPGGLDLLLEQYTETLDSTSWQVDLTGAPFWPWRIAVLASDTGDTGAYVCHLDTDDSGLNAGITATATSFAVKTNSGPLWTTLADDFPLDVDIEGERVRVTNITGSSSPQTFTVARSINGVVKAHLANAPVIVWRPTIPGL